MGPVQGASVLLFLGVLTIFLVDADNGRDGRLSRKKRYVVFPEGSSFSIALCMTMHTLTSDNIFTEGLNWGISYDLPNESKPALEPFLELRKDKRPNKYHIKDKKNYSKNSPAWNNDKKFYQPMIYTAKVDKKYYKPDYNYLRRRHRRDLYNKLEIIMNAMNFDGRSCVLRALCEASQRLMPRGNTLVEEMMRIAFTLPLKRVLSYEPDEHRTYTNAHRAGYDGRDCSAMFASCSFSLIDMALGKYNGNEREYMAAAAAAPSLARNFVVSSGNEDSNVQSFDETLKNSNFQPYNMK